MGPKQFTQRHYLEVVSFGFAGACEDQSLKRLHEAQAPSPATNASSAAYDGCCPEPLEQVV